MLDFVCVFSKSGVLLWFKSMCKIEGDPVNELIQTVLLEERIGSRSTNSGPYTLKWTLANELELVFVAVYQKILTLFYVESLLEAIRKEFIASYEPEIKLQKWKSITFDEKFDRLVHEAEVNSLNQKNLSSDKNENGNRTSRKDLIKQLDLSGQSSGQIVSENTKEKDTEGKADQDESSDGDSDENANSKDDVLKRLKQRNKIGPNRKRSGKKTGGAENTSIENTSAALKGKTNRVWHDGRGSFSKKDMDNLDRSKKTNGTYDGEVDDKQFDEFRSTFLPEEGERGQWEEDENEEPFDSSNEEENENVSKESEPNKSSWSFGKSMIGGFLKNITGNKVLEKEDVEPILTQMKEQLISKNVATEITDDICSSILLSLEGQRLGSFTRVKTVVQDALKTAILRVLTPQRNIDVLREVMEGKSNGRPYSIVFVGINGVGKSTSLAKVAYFLKQHGVKTLIAACDTFRSGAVEQLKVHAKCLEVPLFDQGYAKDASSVCKSAMRYALENNFDCTLIDTAGRMQNNEPLMKALARLVSDNNPDLILFVGEALVGNDGIDQLAMFDRALSTFAPINNRRKIDGIVLTKFDTVGDKVGAALSMSYKTGQPIVFVGTGQKYTHLRRLNVNTVIKSLF